ncbi:MAG: hypothetical protein JJU15_15050 [Pararhodobacter sp.]|nr:hypothetical protein [Pararhodobacter sp.]
MSALTRDLKSLARLLDDARAALRISDLQRIGQLSPKLLALIQRIEDYPPAALGDDETSIGEEIADSARRNQRLIAAALEGLRNAQELLVRARLPSRHETYARDGARQKIDSAPVSLERRA